MLPARVQLSTSEPVFKYDLPLAPAACLLLRRACRGLTCHQKFSLETSHVCITKQKTTLNSDVNHGSRQP